ncbi:TPA: hypothetical protein DIS56_02130 [Candidatus Saccharibacteria bacterium]|nr:MAG: hypothetical protein UX30_C0002G0061 [Candidatus Saccharibacteria bacterium GW2011_GWA2_46_10]OGL35767.1 MAG: hypothetical protein A3F05_01880 [Candidatus Saccharibacteria bacterium RIFCSPHIGHO2_12_FULL_47_17]HCM51909.1 hypothetical protein [Candidatus Saccharibacteria bacterium]
MINLIPPAYGQAIRIGRTNTRLMRWLLSVTAAAAGLIVIVGVGWLYLNHQNSKLTKDISSVQQQLDAQNLGEVQKQAQTINSNVKVINQVLNREIRFSNLIQEIGSVLPNGSVLNSLTLSKVDGAVDLSTGTRDYTAASQIAVNLSDPKNNIFEKVDIVNITCDASPTSTYACNANYKALFSKTTKNRFLNAATGGQ